MDGTATPCGKPPRPLVNGGGGQLEDSTRPYHEGIEFPSGIALDADGNVYLSARGNAMHVLVFDRSDGISPSPRNTPWTFS
ncbi:MAG TPA: hypothetical protein VM223_08065 [Planctomycetota bacterium]|nr:hypothetical protein [Planctomycetota bacterium]